MRVKGFRVVGARPSTAPPRGVKRWVTRGLHPPAIGAGRVSRPAGGRGRHVFGGGGAAVGGHVFRGGETAVEGRGKAVKRR